MIHVVSWISVVAGAICALFLLISVTRNPEKMGVMNAVWPLIGLAGSVFAVWLYLRHKSPGRKPNWLPTAIATCHCGAGCTLGDILAESVVIIAPGILVWFGLGSIWGMPLFASWTLDFCLAFAIGIAFQYFSIVPMRGLSFGPGLVAALKADTLSLTSWQIGMYGFMGFIHFAISPVKATQIEFWFAMQFAMMMGFVTSYPVNIWLLRAGLKEKMS
jgi:hypothetical protein